MCPVRRTVRRGAAASERTGVVALRGGGVESVGMRAGEAERRRGGGWAGKRFFFENNFDFSEIRVIFVRS